MPDLLLELLSEEIPARMQMDAVCELHNRLTTKLALVGFDVDDGPQSSFLVTPRRLTVIIKNLPTAQPDVSIERKGPKTDAPEAAIQGFLKSTGLSLDKLENRNGVYFANIHQKGKPTAEILKTIIEEILAKFPWPKQMRWGDNKITWVRPLHSILCLFDGKVVPVEFGGIKAGNLTYGHRFLSPEAITVKTPEKHESLLEKAHVIADRDKRKAEIWKQAETLAAKHSLTVKRDEGLLEEVTGLVEWPEVLIGNIDPKFMDLPPEVLSTSMRTHQKYFSLFPSPSGRGKGEGPHPNPLPEGEGVAPHFLVASNIKAKDGGKAIIAGNERVLRARLSDAKFFWEQDLKKRLDEWAKNLSGVIFHEKLGTVADKVERITDLAEKLTEYVPGADKAKVKRAAELCKADLVTGMVGEFAELQGIMGRYYAMAGKESPEVADAIRDHYKPQGPNDSVPSNPVSICIALADKLDTLIEMFAIDEKPTGSKDPFALRRAALGILRIIIVNNLQIYLDQLLTIAAITEPDGTLAIQEPNVHAQRLREIKHFFLERIKVILRDEGIRHDIIEAAINLHPTQSVQHLILNPTLIRKKAFALQSFLTSTDSANLLAAYRRAANIVAAEEKKDKKTYRGEVNSKLLESKEEQELYKVLSETKPSINEKIKAEKFDLAMGVLSSLRAPVDAFFDKTTVNCDNAALRENRLFILSELKGIMDNIADFSKIEG